MKLKLITSLIVFLVLPLFGQSVKYNPFTTNSAPGPVAGAWRFTGAHTNASILVTNLYWISAVGDGSSLTNIGTNAMSSDLIDWLLALSGDPEDGDKGEISISGGVWAIDSGVVTTQKMSASTISYLREEDAILADGSVPMAATFNGGGYSATNFSSIYIGASNVMAYIGTKQTTNTAITAPSATITNITTDSIDADTTLVLKAGGVTQLSLVGDRMDVNQPLAFSVDNTYDIGDVGDNRPKDIYFAGKIYGDGSELTGISGGGGIEPLTTNSITISNTQPYLELKDTGGETYSMVSSNDNYSLLSPDGEVYRYDLASGKHVFSGDLDFGTNTLTVSNIQVNVDTQSATNILADFGLEAISVTLTGDLNIYQSTNRPSDATVLESLTVYAKAGAAERTVTWNTNWINSAGLLANGFTMEAGELAVIELKIIGTEETNVMVQAFSTSTPMSLFSRTNDAGGTGAITNLAYITVSGVASAADATASSNLVTLSQLESYSAGSEVYYFDVATSVNDVEPSGTVRLTNSASATLPAQATNTVTVLAEDDYIAFVSADTFTSLSSGIGLAQVYAYRSAVPDAASIKAEFFILTNGVEAFEFEPSSAAQIIGTTLALYTFSVPITDYVDANGFQVMCKIKCTAATSDPTLTLVTGGSYPAHMAFSVPGATYVKKSGDTMTGDLSLGDNDIADVLSLTGTGAGFTVKDGDAAQIVLDDGVGTVGVTAATISMIGAVSLEVPSDSDKALIITNTSTADSVHFILTGERALRMDGGLTLWDNPLTVSETAGETFSLLSDSDNFSIQSATDGEIGQYSVSSNAWFLTGDLFVSGGIGLSGDTVNFSGSVTVATNLTVSGTNTAAVAVLTNVITAWQSATMDGTNLVIDCNLGSFWRVYVGSTNVYCILSNGVAGQSGKIKIIGDGSTSKTYDVPTAYRDGSGTVTWTNALSVGWDFDTGTNDTNKWTTALQFN